jgi:hypothetical protein
MAIVMVEIPVDEETAVALADPHRREAAVHAHDQADDPVR